MKINTTILRGKIKSFKGSVGYRNDIKKAIVTLKEGNTIDAALEIIMLNKFKPVTWFRELFNFKRHLSNEKSVKFLTKP